MTNDDEEEIIKANKSHICNKMYNEKDKQVRYKLPHYL